MTIEYRFSKHFTREEASQVVREYRAEIAEMMELANVLLASGYDIYQQRYFGGLGPNGDRETPLEMKRLLEILKRLQERGILVKSAENGILDFPALRRSGEEVFWCFRFGEPDILYWHALEDGFVGRRPLED